MSFPDEDHRADAAPLGWGTSGPTTVTTREDETRSFAPPPVGGGRPAPHAPAPARRRRRWPWVALTLVLTAALAAAVAYGYDTFRIAEGWQERALSAEGDAARLSGELSAAEAEGARLAEALWASESDVNDLEGRLDELAAEKAAVADQRAAAEIERDVYQNLSSAAADVTVALERCVELQGDFYALLLAAGPESDPDLLGEMANEVNAECTAALGQARSLQDAVRSSR